MSGEPAGEPRPTEGVERLGRYILRYRIAQGGMASVYLARLQSQAGFEKWVAVKTIHPHIATSPKFVSMFMDEARLAARLDHPNLCTVFDFGESQGTYFIAMEYLHGESLGVVARRTWSMGLPMPLEFAARVIADAARGLHAAHELRLENGQTAGVVHRDVSPENIFVTYAGISKIVDFGVARSNQQASDRTATGELKGKVAYMSPEQIREARVDRRTDIWALGVVLWEVTVGRRLFRRQSDAATVLAVMRDTIPLPSRVRPEYPELLEAIVMRALDREPARRFQTALEFARALESFLSASGLPAGAGDVGEFMQTLFADQIALRDEILRRGTRVAPFEELVSVWQGPAISAPPPPRASPEPDPDDVRAEAPTSVFEVEDSGPAIPLTRPHREEAYVLGDAEITEAPRTVYVTAGAVKRPGTGNLGVAFGAALAIVSGAMLYLVLRPRPAPGTLRARPAQMRPGPVPAPTPGGEVAGPVVRREEPVARVPPARGPAATVVRRARSVTAAPPATEGAARPGYLSFTSTPAADVYESGALLGVTPILDRAVSPGAHEYRFVLRDGSASRTVNVEVHPGASSLLNVNWRPRTPDGEEPNQLP